METLIHVTTKLRRENLFISNTQDGKLLHQAPMDEASMDEAVTMKVLLERALLPSPRGPLRQARRQAPCTGWCKQTFQHVELLIKNGSEHYCVQPCQPLTVGPCASHAGEIAPHIATYIKVSEYWCGPVELFHAAIQSQRSHSRCANSRFMEKAYAQPEHPYKSSKFYTFQSFYLLLAAWQSISLLYFDQAELHCQSHDIPLRPARSDPAHPWIHLSVWRVVPLAPSPGKTESSSLRYQDHRQSMKKLLT